MLAELTLALSLTMPLPGTGVTYLDKTGDPVRVVAYGLGTKSVYLRNRDGTAFTQQKGVEEAALSPDGRAVAAVAGSYRSGYDELLLTDRGTGAVRRIRTVKQPLTASYASWSRDSAKVALTVERKDGGKWRSTGFAVVDVKTGSTSTVTLTGVDSGTTFWWNPDGNLVARYGTGLRVYRPSDGAVVSTQPGLGRPTGPERSYSPSGKRLATWCPSQFKEQLCVVDPAKGTITRRVAAQPVALFGWWDEDHVIAATAYRGAYRLSVLDLNGKSTRVLAAVTRKTWDGGFWVAFARN
ncbi:hypothetical protein ABZ297_25165 [Nonomuraea sp. NPDC005983]|uniref:TolB family protein n=1 Tax=Nonomuraea sp. NPDC005983 TaxID=3155595 RepID=UPI0033B820F1